MGAYRNAFLSLALPLFAFSEPLGEVYTGEWRDASVFTVKVLRTAQHPPVLNGTVHPQLGSGATAVRVDDASGFAAGDTVVVERAPSAEWIASIGAWSPAHIYIHQG